MYALFVILKVRNRRWRAARARWSDVAHNTAFSEAESNYYQREGSSELEAKDRFDGLMSLIEMRRSRANYRDENNWRFSYAIWAFIFALVYVEINPDSSLRTGLLGSIGFGVVVLWVHALNESQTWHGMWDDMKRVWRYHYVAERIVLRPRWPATSRLPQTPQFRKDKWVRSRLLVTTLAVLLYIAVSTGSGVLPTFGKSSGEQVEVLAADLD